MSCGREEKPCRCGKASTVNLQRMSSIVRDIGDPCLSPSSMKVGQMLKPEKWRASFDSDGKVLAFHKALRLIILGGVDPSIRPEVWEFLLGCYALDSTAEFRRQLREARRDRYSSLIRQCQMMNSSVGTGSLAYVVGSKVLDTRTSSKDDRGREDKTESRQTSIDSVSRLDNFQHLENDCTDMSQSQACQRESFTDSADLVSVRDNDVGAAYDTSTLLASSPPYTSGSQEVGREANGSQSGIQTYFDFPPLSVTNLFEEKEEDREEKNDADSKFATHDMFQMGDNRMHSFQITNNTDLVMEQNGFPSNDVPPIKSEIEMIPPNACGTVSQSQKLASKPQIVSSLKISSIPESPLRGTSSSREVNVSEERVSEWRWTLHRIVVDVVRTDSHLEFYEDTRNLARMSDILAVYAWADPATGYCQGMSDLLSPFVVLFEDNADAFWCFEMLLRRMRENFQMEGPTGVMKQLQVLWCILELTDREMFAHLSHIGAESLHFAFRMLLVLFRRELSFNDSLRMWEMMWGADFDESLQYNLEENCLDLLVIHDPTDLEADAALAAINNGSDNSESAAQSKHGKGESNSENTGVKSSSTRPFCGLTKSFWSRNDRVPICSPVSSTTKGGDRLSVFCVAAILIMNRQKVIRETHSFDDMIKIFNDNMLKINVKRCIRMAIKLRKKYFYKIVKSKSAARDFDYCHASSPTS
ncbi:small G protein signaling modulator 1-like [Rhodamnia argentea]|uniref:Small G protein signaling modulator 1-like n=1 Tax=Rhodamnia argentea TaxID=178133 RepID=A0ABM3HQ43_9MYRT|nr:small G protein signaling modulator 1-like [Rhodamnia argentea]